MGQESLKNQNVEQTLTCHGISHIGELRFFIEEPLDTGQPILCGKTDQKCFVSELDGNGTLKMINN
jgi:hypothetical protein